MSSNKLSFLTDEVIPKYVRENNSDYVVLVQNYFEYLERQFGEYDIVANLLEYRDIDTTVDEYLDEFRKTYAKELPNNTSVNLKLLIKKIREFYKSKGNEDSLKFLFKTIYNSSVEFYYPAVDVLKTSIAKHKLSEKNSHITDSNYWQDFSYVLRTGVSGHIYEKMLYAMAHPAGLKFFGEFKPASELHGLTIPEYIDSWILLLFIDYVISGLNINTADTFRDIELESFGNGPRDSVSKFLWQRETHQNSLLDTFEDTIISQLDGKSSEQHSLVFYNRKKQDINSLIIINRYVEFLNSGVNTSYYWNNLSDITTNLVNDISTTAPSTIQTAGATDFTIFSNGQKIYLEAENDLEEGLYTVSGSPTSTTITVVEATLGTTSAISLGDVSLSTRTAADWYTTPLRSQPTVADDTVHIVSLPIGEYSHTIKAHATNTFKTMSSVNTLSDALFFYNGDKIVNSDLSVGVQDGDNFRNITSTLPITSGNEVEYYVTDNTVEEHIIINSSDLNISMSGKPALENKNNLQVFVEGVLLYPTEYSYENSTLKINQTLWGSTIVTTNRVEIVLFDRDVQNNVVTHNTDTGQTLFEIKQNIEKRKWVEAWLDTAFTIAAFFSTDLWLGDQVGEDVVNNLDTTTDSMIWTFNRDGNNVGSMTYDTIRGVTNGLRIDESIVATTTDANSLTTFNADGFTIGNGTILNSTNDDFVAWTFKKQNNFFSLFNYSGNEVAGRAIPHGLGAVPGMVVIVPTNNAGSSYVQVATQGGGQYLRMDVDAVSTTSASIWDNTNMDATNVIVGNPTPNSIGTDYVGYAFGHDISNNGLIQCGEYTGNGSTSGPSISLGWQPQFILIKALTTSGNQGDWFVMDTTRGMGAGNDILARWNSGGEIETTNLDVVNLNSDGFSLAHTSTCNQNTIDYWYMAIREA